MHLPRKSWLRLCSGMSLRVNSSCTALSASFLLDALSAVLLVSIRTFIQNTLEYVHMIQKINTCDAYCHTLTQKYRHGLDRSDLTIKYDIR